MRQLFRSTGELLFSLVLRDIAVRYRGSVFGVLWVLLPSLFTLALYSLVFGVALRVQWPGVNSPSAFVLLMFSGLVVHAAVSEMMGRAPILIVGQISYVKKVVFPLAILPMAAASAGFFQWLINVGLLMLLSLALWPGSLLGFLLSILWLLPLAALFWMLLCGIGWFFATVGVYLRDIAQLTPMLSQILLFTAPIVYPAESIPLQWRWILQLNPLTWFVESVRNILLWGRSPDWALGGVWAIVILGMAVASLAIFQKARRGFADVL